MSATPTNTTPASVFAIARRVLRIPSLSRVQAIIGTLAGIVSIGGAVLSVVPSGHEASTGDLVAIVKAAGRPVADATIEVLTPQNALVATVTPDAGGRATQELREGVYLVRVSHPRYAADVRRVQVAARQTVEIRANLRPGSSTSIDRSVNNAVTAVRRAFRF